MAAWECQTTNSQNNQASERHHHYHLIKELQLVNLEPAEKVKEAGIDQSYLSPSLKKPLRQRSSGTA